MRIHGEELIPNGDQTSENGQNQRILLDVDHIMKQWTTRHYQGNEEEQIRVDKICGKYQLGKVIDFGKVVTEDIELRLSSF